MTDKQIQAKLEKLCRICNELNAEAKARYGPEGQLFLEPEHGFYLMAHDDGGPNRQDGVRFSSNQHVMIGAGAW